MRTLLLLALLLSAAGAAGAQKPPVAPPAGEEPGEPGPVEELVTDRPDVTESALTVAPGAVQLEAGVSLSAQGGASTVAGPGTLVRIGITDRLEARLGWEGHVDEEGGASGSGDGEVGLKLRVLEGGGGDPDVSLLAAASVPIGDDAFSTGTVDPSLTGIAALDLAEGLGLGVNAGVALVETAGEIENTANGAPGAGAADDSRATVLSWSASLGADVGSRAGAFLEYFGQDVEAEPPAHSVDAGLTFLVTPDVQLDASAGAGLADPADDWFVGAGFSGRLDLGF